jgi:MFS family permease
MSGLLGLRFLAGLIGAPSLGCESSIIRQVQTGETNLAVGGASIGDMGGGVFFSRLILVWALGAVMGPTIGPVLGGFAFEWAGWKGTIWCAVH